MDLSKFPTRQLLKALKRVRINYFYEDNEDRCVLLKRLDKGGREVRVTPSYDELKEELGKREHIPSSKESKEKRRTLAYKYRKHVK